MKILVPPRGSEEGVFFFNQEKCHDLLQYQYHVYLLLLNKGIQEDPESSGKS